MANLTGKMVFKLLLIVTLAIQPIANTYAMASMSHSQPANATTSEQLHSGHHVMSQYDLKQDVSEVHHDNHDHANNGDINDCCDTSACCPAAIVDIYFLDQVPTPSYSAHFHNSLEGVILPSEIKPPQRIFS
jgi:hypothetical protein